MISGEHVFVDIQGGATGKGAMLKITSFRVRQQARTPDK
jgi:hypothetical protein